MQHRQASRSSIDILVDARHLQTIHGPRLIVDAVRRLGQALARAVAREPLGRPDPTPGAHAPG